MSRTIKSKFKSKRDPVYCLGPGGVNCSCCFPAPGSKYHKALIKAARRNEAKMDFICQEAI